MIPVPSSSDKPLKPILKRSPSSVRKAVTFSATNSQVFFADDWDRSAVEVVSKLSYSDVLELKQLSLDSLPSDRHASMGLSPLLSHVPLTLCPLACEESKISASPKLESRAAPPSPPASSPLVIPDLSILASPASVNETLRGSPPPLSPPSSEAPSSPPVSLGTVSPHSSASSPESSPPKPNVRLTAPIPVRRTLMMNFMPLLPEPGSELPSPVLSAASSSLSEDSSDTGETASTLAPQTPITPRTPHTPQTPTSLSPIPASPTSPTLFTFAPQQTQGPPTGRASKTRTSRAEIAQFSALSGSVPGELGAMGLQTPRKPADGGMSPVSPISPVSDSTVSVTSSTLVRPVPRRAFTAPVAKDVESPMVSNALVRRGSIGSLQGDEEPITRTKTSRSFDGGRSTRLAIASAAWADGVQVEKEVEKEDSVPVARPSSAHSLRQVPLPSSTPTPTRPVVRPQHRSHSLSDTQPTPQPQSFKYVNPYAQIRESDEPRPVPTVEESRQHPRPSSLDKTTQRSRATPSKGVGGSSSLPTVPQYVEDTLGLGLGGPRPPASMTRPNPIHRASVHGYPYSSGRPPSPTPQTFSRPYPSPLSSTVPLPGPQPRPGKPLASKDANVRPGSATLGSSYTLGLDGLGTSFKDRKPRSANDTLPSDPVLAPLCAPMPRPKNSKVSR
ncbi:hypothetical protein FRC06_011291 [Ceratobasidium sp. 370]|nr:hypothetical protein FRC06_011291 [Ceratobasidium sp. 370]